MVRARVIIAAAGLLAGCRDGIGPPQSEVAVPDAALRPLLWSPAVGTPAFAARSSGSAHDVLRSGSDQSALVTLDNYQTSFWAFRGRETSVEVHYRAPDATWMPFALLTVPPSALLRRPGGELFRDGDSVLISLTLDPLTLDVEFQPSGLVFSSSTPAQFQLRYTGANPDLDTNGRVDSVDDQIRRTQLGIWVQEHLGDPWNRLNASHTLDQRLFIAGVPHFSKLRGGVAISF